MLNLNRICCYIFMLGFTLMTPSMVYISFLDEFLSFILLAVAAADCIFNHNWRKYSLLWLITAIMTCYAIYSILFLSYNTPRYIITDWIIEIKPYVPFCVFLAISPRFTDADKKIIKAICWINITIIAICFAGGMSLIKLVMFHPTYPAIYALISGLLFYFCSFDTTTGTISKKDILTAFMMMSLGIFGLKAKFFGTYILAAFLIFLYRPGILRHFNHKNAIIIIGLCFLVLAATWNKFSYYFLQGNSDTFDPTVVQSFARPVLYATGGLILIDHFPFGTGLASFASYPSGDNYSDVYYEYGISSVWGLSPDKPEFICDAFFPSLAQYGVLGIILFIWFWVYAYSYLRNLIRYNSKLFRVPFVTGSVCIIFILIESTSANTFTQTGGLIAMCLLGMCCSMGKDLIAPQSPQQSSSPSIRKI